MTDDKLISFGQIEDYNDGYYHFRKDVEDYPNIDTFIVWSRRGPGKTYSFLRYMVETDQFFIYMKRNSFQTICASTCYMRS